DLIRVHQSTSEGSSHVVGVTSPVIQPLRDRFLGDVRKIGNTLLIAVGAVLLIACVNVAALMMARGGARSREIAIRTAMGASRARILAQLLTESVLMAVCAGAIGVALGAALLKGMIPLMPSNIPKWISFELDARFALFCLVVTGSAAIVFAL